LGVLVGLITSVTLNLMPVAAAAIVAVGILFLTRTLKPKDAYGSVEWRILFLIYGMLGLGLALDKSGAAAKVSLFLVELGNGLPEDMRALALLALVFLVTSLLTEILSNNAAVVLMAPISFGIAATLGVDARPFAIATCVAASASFATPVG